MRSVAKAIVVSSAAGCLLFAGTTAASASTPTTVPTGSPVECLSPALADPAGSLTGALEDPVGAVQADAACLSGQG